MLLADPWVLCETFHFSLCSNDLNRELKPLNTGTSLSSFDGENGSKEFHSVTYVITIIFNRRRSMYTFEHGRVVGRTERRGCREDRHGANHPRVGYVVPSSINRLTPLPHTPNASVVSLASEEVKAES